MADDLVEDWWLSDTKEPLEVATKQKRLRNAEKREKNETKKQKRKLEDKDTVVGKKRRKDSDIENEAGAREETEGQFASKVKKSKVIAREANNMGIRADDSESNVNHDVKKVTALELKAKKNSKLKSEENKEKKKKIKVDDAGRESKGGRVQSPVKVERRSGGNDGEQTSAKTENSAAGLTVGNQTQQKNKKKKKRRSITAALADPAHKDIPLAPWDLTSRIDQYFAGKLSSIELDELKLTSAHFAVCNDLTHTPVSYVRQAVPHWKKEAKRACVQPGTPLILLVSASGLRAANLIRALAELKMEEFRFAKLFAKHLKVEAQTKFLRAHKTHVAVGTPNRLHQLIDSGVLCLDALKLIVLDWSWRDAKQRRLIDHEQVRADVMDLLRKDLLPRLRAGGARIGLL